jgi:LAS superfamily LD-carboxypeptidase LdcB
VNRCCRYCDERYIGYHSACPRYLAEAEQNARRLEFLSKQNDFVAFTVESIYRSQSSRHNAFKNLCRSER